MPADTIVLFRQKALILHNARDIAEIVRQLLGEPWPVEPENLSSRRTYRASRPI
ncbi:hypothetical protein STTU_p0010 (plasmid) [Streptomyces sp. Tu6071]|nr:hypothetical protein STTU_p0010 [Streptomyces sp. Tu6071]